MAELLLTAFVLLALLPDCSRCSVTSSKFHLYQKNPESGHRPYRYIIDETRSSNPPSAEARDEEGYAEVNHDDSYHEYENDREEEEEETEYGHNDGPENSDGGGLHIHLKSLIDTDLISYLVNEVPWSDIFDGGNKLTRTEDVKYVTEHLVEEGDADAGFNRNHWDQEYKRGAGWDDRKSEAGLQTAAMAESGSMEQKRLTHVDRNIRRTHSIRKDDCPSYFGRHFGAGAIAVRRTSLPHYIECERERKLGANPFGNLFDSLGSEGNYQERPLFARLLHSPQPHVSRARDDNRVIFIRRRPVIRLRMTPRPRSQPISLWHRMGDFVRRLMGVPSSRSPRVDRARTMGRAHHRWRDPIRRQSP